MIPLFINNVWWIISGNTIYRLYADGKMEYDQFPEISLAENYFKTKIQKT